MYDEMVYEVHIINNDFNEIRNLPLVIESDFGCFSDAVSDAFHPTDPLQLSSFKLANLVRLVRRVLAVAADLDHMTSVVTGEGSVAADVLVFIRHALPQTKGGYIWGGWCNEVGIWREISGNSEGWVGVWRECGEETESKECRYIIVKGIGEESGQELPKVILYSHFKFDSNSTPYVFVD